MSLSVSRAMVVTEPGRMELREFPLPEIGDNDGLLLVERVGVCGSDPGIFKGKAGRAPRPYPLILGHEIVGRIHRVGAQAASRWGVREGERVVVEYAFGCGECPACQAGRYTLCHRNYCYGSMIGCSDPPHLFGAYADYLYLPSRAMVHRIGEDLSPDEGVLIGAVLGNAVRWLTRHRTVPDGAGCGHRRAGPARHGGHCGRKGVRRRTYHGGGTRTRQKAGLSYAGSWVPTSWSVPTKWTR